MLTIRREQLFVFQQEATAQLVRDLSEDLARFHPTDLALLGEAGLTDVARAGVAEGLEQGLSTRGELRKFLHLRMVLGSGLLRDPVLPWAGEIAQHGLGPAGTLQRLLEEAKDFVELANGSNGAFAVRAMLLAAALPWSAFAEAERDANPEAATLSLLSRLWPQKMRLLPVSARARFLETTAANARRDGLFGAVPTRCHAVMAFLLGAEFSSDPAMPWAAESLTATANGSAEARAAALAQAARAALAALRPMLTPAQEA